MLHLIRSGTEVFLLIDPDLDDRPLVAALGEAVGTFDRLDRPDR